MKPSDPGPVDVKNVRLPYVAWECVSGNTKYRLVVDERKDKRTIEQCKGSDALGNNIWRTVDEDDYEWVVEAMSDTLIENFKRGRVPVAK